MLQLCDSLATCPGCTLPLFHVSWDWLQPPHDPVQDNFQVLYLGRTPQQLLGLSNAYNFRIIVDACKKAIIKNWLNPELATVTDWFNVMHEIFIMERLTFELKLKTALCENVGKDGLNLLNHTEQILSKSCIVTYCWLMCRMKQCTVVNFLK